MTRARWYHVAFVAALVMGTGGVLATTNRLASVRTSQLSVVELRKPEGQILGYRQLAGSFDVQVRDTRLAPDARIKSISVEPVLASPPLITLPALWFAVTGWTLALVLLFRRRSI